MTLQHTDLQSIAEVRDMIARAKCAHREAMELSQQQIDQIVTRMAEAGWAAAEELAAMAVEETGFGNVKDKILKNQFASRKLLEAILPMKTVGVIRECPEQKTMEVGVPVGVVAGLVPSTNPTSTAIFKSMIAMKAACSIIFSPHPSAQNCILRACEIMSQAAEAAGAPKNMFQTMTRPHMAGTRELMTNPGVNLILATGGKDMVKAAYSSGIPALGVGPGNVPAFIERTADIPRAVADIIASKTFDNGVICASEQAVVTEDCIAELVIAEFMCQGCHFLSDEESARVGALLTRGGGKLNPGIVGKSAERIANMAGISVPAGTKVLLYAEKGVGVKYPFSMEKLSPTLAFYAEENWHKACALCIELLNYGGLGHSLVIHSRDEAVIREFALKKPVSRMLVNTPSSQGAIGATTNLTPSLTLGCGSVGGSATSDNVSPLHLINTRKVAWGLSEPTDPEADPEVERITKLVLDALKNL